MAYTPLIINRLSGSKYYPISELMYSNTNGILTINQLVVRKVIIGQPQSFSGVAIASLGTASSLGRMVVYLDDGAGGIGALDFDSGQVSMSAAGVVTFSFGSAKIYSGIIWVGYVPQSISGSVGKYAAVIGSDPYVSVSSIYSAGPSFGYGLTGITGAPPNPWGSTLNDLGVTNFPVMYLITT